MVYALGTCRSTEGHPQRRPCSFWPPQVTSDGGQSRPSTTLVRLGQESQLDSNQCRGSWSTNRALRCVKQSLVCRHKHVYYYYYDDLVDEHVVVVLVEDHEVVADWQEVVADRQESLGKRSKILFSFRYGKTCVFMLAWLGVAVSAAHCSAPLAPDL